MVLFLVIFFDPMASASFHLTQPHHTQGKGKGIMERFRERITHLVGLGEGFSGELEPTHPSSSTSTPLGTPCGESPRTCESYERSYASVMPIGITEHPPAGEDLVA